MRQELDSGIVRVDVLLLLLPRVAVTVPMTTGGARANGWNHTEGRQPDVALDVFNGAEAAIEDVAQESHAQASGHAAHQSHPEIRGIGGAEWRAGDEGAVDDPDVRDPLAAQAGGHFRLRLPFLQDLEEVALGPDLIAEVVELD